MFSFQELSDRFHLEFSNRHFPENPASLYQPAEYFLGIGGKRIRPVLCLMANELFGELQQRAIDAAIAIELFHNFTLIHDDIMDHAPLRRGMETVHTRYGNATALLTGDVMMVKAYEYLTRVEPAFLAPLLQIFNTAARQVCEGQQLDMDFEKKETVSLDEYLQMIELKTSVLLAASLQIGALLNRAGGEDQKHLYEFGRHLGIAFQIQDDYLDAFGDPARFGKQVGGDIRANKKTFLMIHALETCNPDQAVRLREQMAGQDDDKVAKVLQLFRECGVDSWARDLKNRYITEAEQHLSAIAVPDEHRSALKQLMQFLVQRDH